MVTRSLRITVKSLSMGHILRKLNRVHKFTLYILHFRLSQVMLTFEISLVKLYMHFSDADISVSQPSWYNKRNTIRQKCGLWDFFFFLPWQITLSAPFAFRINCKITYLIHGVRCAGLSDFLVRGAARRHFSLRVAQLFHRKFRRYN
jgi:hypothetical protein